MPSGYQCCSVVTLKRYKQEPAEHPIVICSYRFRSGKAVKMKPVSARLELDISVTSQTAR